ncbi:MAG: preprotein translocase subunit YajC, partial [Clostridia bacterium]|nr:preprotein translocase subunit YajC [Clostridia bacterium]
MNFTNLLLLEEASGAGTGNGTGSTASMLIYLVPILLLGVVFYFFILRPQKKQERETNEMRNSIEVGDVIATAGGIVGMVVKVKDDMLLIETGGDRTKIQLQKWAVHSVLEKANEPETAKEVKDARSEKAEKKSGGLF